MTNLLFVFVWVASFRSCPQKRDERTLKNPDVKIVDFGNATYEHEHHTSVVSTRHYRAPEVILGTWLLRSTAQKLKAVEVCYWVGMVSFRSGLGPCLWCLECGLHNHWVLPWMYSLPGTVSSAVESDTIINTVTYTMAFENVSLCLQTHDSKEHLAMMERVLGPFPTNLLQKTKYVNLWLSETQTPLPPKNIHTYQATWTYSADGVDLICLLIKTFIIIMLYRKRRFVYRSRLDWDVHGSSGRFVKKHCKPLKVRTIWL